MSGGDVIDYESVPARKRLIGIRLAAWAICAIVLYFVVRALVRQFQAVDWSQVDLKIFPALTAIVCVFGVSAMQLVARWTLLIAYGYPLNWRVQLPVAWVPQLGKYVPGGIASVGGAVYLLRKHGVPGAIGLSVAVLLDALAVMAGLIVSTPLLLWRPVRERMPLAWLVCAGMVIVGIVMLHPRVFVGMLNGSLRLIKRQPIAQTPPLAKYLWPVLASFGQWLFAGFGLWFMTMAVTPVQTSLIPLFIASAALAMTVSYLMPFTPGGLGIREGLYLITLGPTIGPRVAIVVVAMRVIQTVIEILLAAVGAWVMRQTPAIASAPQR
jgi:glycosyltransferase 2 family protein